MIIGRKQEKQRLDKSLTSTESEFMVVWVYSSP